MDSGIGKRGREGQRQSGGRERAARDSRAGAHASEEAGWEAGSRGECGRAPHVSAPSLESGNALPTSYCLSVLGNESLSHRDPVLRIHKP